MTFAKGAVVRERIVNRDDQARRVVSAAIGGRPTHHHASMQVMASEENQRRLVWITDLLPNEGSAIIRERVKQGAATRKRTLEAETTGEETRTE